MVLLVVLLLLEGPEPEQAGLAGGDVLVENDRHLCCVCLGVHPSVGAGVVCTWNEGVRRSNLETKLRHRCTHTINRTR